MDVRKTKSKKSAKKTKYGSDKLKNYNAIIDLPTGIYYDDFYRGFPLKITSCRRLDEYGLVGDSSKCGAYFYPIYEISYIEDLGKQGLLISHDRKRGLGIFYNSMSDAEYSIVRAAASLSKMLGQIVDDIDSGKRKDANR